MTLISTPHGCFMEGSRAVTKFFEFILAEAGTRQYCADPMIWPQWSCIASLRHRFPAYDLQKDTPPFNYDVLWTTFQENYPFFKLHGTDWRAVDTKFRPLVHPDTSADELFTIFRQMLEPLRDSHIVLDVFPPGAPRGKDWLKTPLKEVWLHKPDPELFEDADFDRANKIIESRYLKEKAQTFCGGQIRFGLMRSGRDRISRRPVISSIHIRRRLACRVAMYPCSRRRDLRQDRGHQGPDYRRAQQWRRRRCVRS